MVKVGDQFRCENITVKTIQGTKFSKGIFTLLDLGPPRSIWSGNLSNKSCILVRGSTDLEGWIDAEDFIEDHGSAMGGSREWLSLDQLEAAREAEKMALKKHLQSITAAILSSPSMAHRTQSVQLPLLSLPSFSMSRPKTSAAGAGPSNPFEDEVRSAPTLGAQHRNAAGSATTSPASFQTSTSSTSQSKKRTLNQIEQEHLREVKRLEQEYSQMRHKIQLDHEREMKHLKLKHDVKVLKANLAEAEKKLDDFEREE